MNKITKLSSTIIGRIPPNSKYIILNKLTNGSYSAFFLTKNKNGMALLGRRGDIIIALEELDSLTEREVILPVIISQNEIE